MAKEHIVYVREVVNYTHKFTVDDTVTDPGELEKIARASWLNRGSPSSDFTSIEDRSYEIEGSGRPSFEDEE